MTRRCGLVSIPLETVTFDATVMDADYGHVFKVTSGEGWGCRCTGSVCGLTGHGAGFVAAMTSSTPRLRVHRTGTVEVKLVGGTDSAIVDTATYPGSTDLGGGWYELSIPFSDFSNSDAANMAAHTGWLIGPPGTRRTLRLTSSLPTSASLAIGSRPTAADRADQRGDDRRRWLADVYYSLDNDVWDTDYSNLSLAQGTNTVSFYQVDGAGNQSAVRSVTLSTTMSLRRLTRLPTRRALTQTPTRRRTSLR